MANDGQSNIYMVYEDATKTITPHLGPPDDMNEMVRMNRDVYEQFGGRSDNQNAKVCMKLEVRANTHAFEFMKQLLADKVVLPRSPTNLWFTMSTLEYDIIAALNIYEAQKVWKPVPSPDAGRLMDVDKEN